MEDAESGDAAEFGAVPSRRKEMMPDSAGLAVSETHEERGRAERRGAGLTGPK